MDWVEISLILIGALCVVGIIGLSVLLLTRWQGEWERKRQTQTMPRYRDYSSTARRRRSLARIRKRIDDQLCENEDLHFSPDHGEHSTR